MAKRDPAATEVIYGLRAGLGALAHRQDDITRIGYAPSQRAELGELLRFAKSRSVPISEMSDAELARVAQSTHHEGLCLQVRARRWLPAAELADRLVRARGAAVALDRVRNPYNVGAILRSAAFFGVDAVLLGAIAPHPALAPDAVRVAEGGAEAVPLARTTDLGDTLGRLRSRGVAIYGADGAASESAIGFAFSRPAVLVLGHEREGLSDRVRARCDNLLAIRGSGAVESLNVAVAAGLFISELMRS